MADARHASDKLYSYCKGKDWSGYDPFDGLNSRFFWKLPLLKDSRLFRMLFLQFMKKSPLNVRPLFSISRGRNPKGMGLFLHGALCLYEKTKDAAYLELIKDLTEWLDNNASPGYGGKCWGYNFDWQSRAFFVPKGTPTAVNTSFIGRAFMKAYEVLGRSEYLDVARNSCDFLLTHLHRLKEGPSTGFSYTPLDTYFVNNANALVASLLGGVFSRTKEAHLRDMAKGAAGFVASHQRDDGCWNYAEDKTGLGVGVDNFHTGFILEGLKIYSESTGDADYQENISKGLDFYQTHFFLENGAPKYFYNKTYPLDIHSAAQAILTLIQLRKEGADMVLCDKIVTWMIENMQDEKGYFYYQKRKYYTNKIPYMRWAQAWAFRALAEYMLLA